MAFNISRGSSSRSSFNENDYVLVNGCKHMRYNPNKEGITEIRVVPALEHGVPQMFIDPSKGNGIEALTDAFAIVDMVSFLGPNKASMICPPPPEGERKGPVQYFIDYIRDMAENDPQSCDPKWLRWCGKGRDRPDNVMSRPTTVIMCQGYLYTHKGKACTDKSGKETVRYPVLLCFNRSATGDFLEKIAKPADSNGAWGSENNALGDPVDLVNGRMMVIEPYDKEFNNRMQTWYRVRLDDSMPISLEDAEAVWKPWDQVIQYNPSLPEIGMWLTKAFDADTVVKVFDTNPAYSECVTESIRKMAERENPSSRSQGYQQYPPTPQSYPPAPQPYQPPTHAAVEKQADTGSYTSDGLEGPFDNPGKSDLQVRRQPR